MTLDRAVAQQVARFTEGTDTSLSKAISSLVLMGLESQVSRKREFFKRLKKNLSNDDPPSKISWSTIFEA